MDRERIDLTLGGPGGVYKDAGLMHSSHYLLPAIRSILKGFPERSTVADLGCGNGSLLGQFTERGWRLHGFELSQSGVAVAAETYPGIRFECADLTDDLSSHALAGRCDVVISTEVVEHIFLPRNYVRNCHTMLAPSGTLVMSTPYHGYFKNLALAASGAMDAHFNALDDYGHIKFWSRRTLTALLQECGFRVVQFCGVGRLPLLWKSMIVAAKKIEQ